MKLFRKPNDKSGELQENGVEFEGCKDCNASNSAKDLPCFTTLMNYRNLMHLMT